MITLYTIGCPQCRVLEKKLKDAGVDFDIETNEEVMMQKGFIQSPMLQVDDSVYNFSEAINWLKEYTTNGN